MPAFLGLENAGDRGIFVLYMSLWVSYGLLNQRAKMEGFEFNSSSAVVLQSFFKLVIATYMYTKQDGSLKFLIGQIAAHKHFFMLYLIPAGLYSVYDILSYVNLRTFDASSYFLLLQFRMVITGCIHQYLFAKKLNRNQWIALLVITFGCVVKTIGDVDDEASNEKGEKKRRLYFISYGLLFVQIISSTFAGVYNEKLLKKQSRVSINLQNIFMYIDSMIAIVVTMSLNITGKSLSDALSADSMATLFSINVLPMVLIMSFVGVVTSLFLKRLDSIRKAIASALELVFLPILSYLFFGSTLNVYLAASICFVAFGVYFYSVPIQDSSNSIPSIRKDDLQKIESSDEVVDLLEKGNE